MKITPKMIMKFICPYGLIWLINEAGMKKPKLKNTGLKQELLLFLALQEKGFNLDRIDIRVDHALGTNYVNEIEIGIKYPDSFYNNCSQLIPEEKNLDYYFNGEMHDSGLRKIMLAPYIQREKSIIIESNDGRIIDNKDKFNYEYFAGLADAKFGLCPGQADINHPASHLWGYRFIESCFVGAIPVLFVIAPLSYRFTNGFYIYWHTKDSDINNFVYQKEYAEFNRELAKERFLLTDEECDKIRKTIK